MQYSLLKDGFHDIEINLKLGKEAPAGSFYSLSKDEHDLLKVYLKEMTRIGKIHLSSSTARRLILFAKQSSGKLRIVVDYREMNAVKIKDKNPLPLITQLMQQFSESTWFTQLNVNNRFNFIQIAPRYE